MTSVAVQATIDLPRVIETAHAGTAQHQVTLTLVEGAGGWRVPIILDADMSTLARDLGLPVLIVARAGSRPSTTLAHHLPTRPDHRSARAD